MPGRVYLLGVGLALVAGAFLLTDALLWRPGATEANARRIREGMTLGEVEAITGRPADWRCPRSGSGRPIALGEWEGEGGTMVVDFGEDARVLFARWRVARGSAGNRPSLLARLCAWFGW
jgi:hypothetical protein